VDCVYFVTTEMSPHESLVEMSPHETLVARLKKMAPDFPGHHFLTFDDVIVISQKPATNLGKQRLMTKKEAGASRASRSRQRPESGDFELESLAMRIPASTSEEPTSEEPTSEEPASENRHLRASASAEPRETPRQSIHVQLVENGTNVSHAKDLHKTCICEIQLRDAKEREVQFKTKLAVLDKLVAEQKANISEKEEKIVQVEGQLVQQEAALAEKTSRSKVEGEELREKLASRVKRVDEMFIGHQKEINALKKEHQQELEIRDADLGIQRLTTKSEIGASRQRPQSGDFEVEGLAMRVRENRHLHSSASIEPRETPKQSIHAQLVENGTNVSHAEDLHSFCETRFRGAKEREIEFKTRLAALDKLVAEQKANISEKEEKNVQVEGQLVQQKAALAEEISRSKVEGEELREKLASRIKRIDEMSIGHQKEINTLKMERQQELEIRDAKITQQEAALAEVMLHSKAEGVELREKLSNRIKYVDEMFIEHQKEINALKKEHQQELEIRDAKIMQQETALAEEISRLKVEGEELREKLSSRIKCVDEMFTGHQKEINTLKKEHQQELKIRDAKMKQLKTQLAKTMDSKASERHQQLESLSKELVRVTEETEMLKIALRLYKSKPNGEMHPSMPSLYKTKSNGEMHTSCPNWFDESLTVEEAW